MTKQLRLLANHMTKSLEQLAKTNQPEKRRQMLVMLEARGYDISKYKSIQEPSYQSMMTGYEEEMNQ